MRVEAKQTHLPQKQVESLLLLLLFIYLFIYFI